MKILECIKIKIFFNTLYVFVFSERKGERKKP